jgi:hypothetical protein
MSFANKLMNRQFRRVDGVVWDLVSGKTGFKTRDGIATLFHNPAVAAQEGGEPAQAESYQVAVNLFDDFGVALPAFAINTPLSAVEIGDVLVAANATGVLGWIIKVSTAQVTYLGFDGHTKVYSPQRVGVLGAEGVVGNGVLIVKNMTSFTGGADGQANALSQLAPLLLLGGDDSALDDILPLLLMGGLTGGASSAGGMNPMMLMLMAGKNKTGGGALGGIDPMMMLMMSGGLGGAAGGAAAGGINPLMLAMLAGKGGLGGSGSALSLGGTAAAPDEGYCLPAPALRQTAAPTLRRLS